MSGSHASRGSSSAFANGSALVPAAVPLALADGELTEAEALRRTARDTRRYARNQETWVRREPARVLGGGGAMKAFDAAALVAEILAQR